MRKEYYCLVAGLSDLIFDASKTGISLSDFRSYLKEELTPDDFFLVESYFWRYDNNNLLLFLQKKDEKINPHGNLTREDFDTIFTLIKEDVLSGYNKWIPPYFERFITAFRNDEPLIPNKSWENQLTELYFEFLETLESSFLKDWYRFEKDFNNILVAANCRKYKLDIEPQLIGANELTEKLIKSSAKDFGIGNEFPKIEQIFRMLEETNLFEREKKIDLIKWELLDETTFFHYFTIEKIFSYVVKVEIIERWIGLSKEIGQELFQKLVNNMETSQKFPEEFSQK